jgi:6-phosphofructokinase 1
VLISEGGNLGVPVPEEGPADAYGHRKKVNIAEFLAGELQPHFPSVRLLTIDLTYILRAGEPVVYDKQFAITCANLIMSAVEKNEHGVMAAARHGTYIYTDMPGKNYPARRVNVAEYHPARYRPYYENMSGKYEPQP